MQLLAVHNDGTTAVELTGAEARALRNVLRELTGSPAAHQLQRLLATAHGEAQPARTVCATCGHQICRGGTPCGAILSLSAVADTKRCQCTGTPSPA